ncbi:MAG: hypothetical protein MI863_08085 [Desulfobacterales bacterium]|nr:hypothetical protein [Desulfobacterales bacterium]
MINRMTVSTLGLTPVTRSMCHDFYLKINSEGSTPDAIRESVSWWQTDKDKLNLLWWVLNYYSDHLDPDRNLRAYVENHLDTLALEQNPEPSPNTEEDAGSESEPSGKLAV